MTASRRWALACAGAVVVQLVVLYWPTAPGGPGVPGFDKAVHVVVFAAVAVTAVLAGARPAVVAGVLVVHAVLSEGLQAAVLPGRSGDPWDVVADVVGVGLGTAAALALRRRAGR